jgi:hypothetical protein
MHLMDVPERKALAAERFAQLQAAVQPGRGPTGRVRRRIGDLLVAAGERTRREALDRQVPQNETA